VVYIIKGKAKGDRMINEWYELSKMTNDQEILVNKVSIKQSGISIEGEFELPPLARVSYDDQVFVAMFIKVHGSIKEMEQAFGVSYPTIKARLNKISERLGFVESSTVLQKEDVLAKLERGEITVNQALERISE
jgi:hypothetical protein